MALENVNPVIFKRTEEREYNECDEDDDVTDEIDSREIFGNTLSGSLVCGLKR